MGKSSLVTLKTWFLKQDLTVYLELTLNSGSFGFHFLSMRSIGKSILLDLFIYLKICFFSLLFWRFSARNCVILIFMSPRTWLLSVRIVVCLMSCVHKQFNRRVWVRSLQSPSKTMCSYMFGSWRERCYKHKTRMYKTWMHRLVAVTSVLTRLRQGDHEFDISLGCIVRLSQNTQSSQTKLNQKCVLSYVEGLNVYLWLRGWMWPRTVVNATQHKLVNLIRHDEILEVLLMSIE